MRKILLSQEDIENTCKRVAHEIEEKIKGIAPVNLLERVPIDSEEIVKLSMMVASRKESQNEN